MITLEAWAMNYEAGLGAIAMIGFIVILGLICTKIANKIF